MEENQVESRVELRYFNTIKGILERDGNFVNNKVDTYNIMSKKTEKVIEHQKIKFTKDENFLLNNYSIKRRDQKCLEDQIKIANVALQGVDDGDDDIYEQVVYRKEKNLKASNKLTDPKLLDHRDKTYNKIVNWRPKNEQPYLERINNAQQENHIRKRRHYDMYNAYETLDSINEMGAKISNLDSKMIDFFKSYTNDN